MSRPPARRASQRLLFACAILCALAVPHLVAMRAAFAERLALLDPSGALEASIARAVGDTSLDVIVIHGVRDEPSAVGAAQGARFVVWRDQSAYVLLDRGTGVERRRPVASLDDEVSATAVAEDLVAWAAAAAETAGADTGAFEEPSVLLEMPDPVPSVPRHRIEVAAGPRYDVAKRFDVLASFSLSYSLRVGPLELGPTIITPDDQSKWEQASYIFHVRAPIDGIAGTRGAVIPRMGAGVLVGTAIEPPRIGMPNGLRDTGVWPVAELGLTLEIRRRRVAFGVDGGATLHARQSLDGVPSVDIAPHVEAALHLRVGLLLY